MATSVADYAKACVLVAQKKPKRNQRISDQFLVSNFETSLFLIVSNFETSLFLTDSGCFKLFQLIYLLSQQRKIFCETV